MKGLKLCGVGHATPKHMVTNQDFCDIIDTNDQWILSRTGIAQRHHCQEETHTDLCIQAGRTALARAGINPKDIGACIVATLSPECTVPAAACLVQAALGLPNDIPCFDLNAACTGFLSGLHTMECLLTHSQRPYGLLIGAEALSKLLNMEDRSTCILFGDGAGAAVVGVFANTPSICAQLGVRGDKDLLHVGGPNNQHGVHIAMEGTAVFKFAVDIVPQCMDQVLQATGKTMEDVDFFVFHQANSRIIDSVVRKYKIPEEKYYKNIANYGNTSAASIPLVLSELWEQGKVERGSQVLCVGFGGGLTWGGALITFD